MPGGGDSSREQGSTRLLAELPPRAGIERLVCDRRGSGGSQGNWRTVGLAALADDALAAVASLRKRDDIDPGAIGLFAASQGTWFALQACARAGGHVAFLVNHSGPALPLLDADTFALRSNVAQAGLTAAEQEEVLALWKLECEALRTGVPPDEHRPLLDAIGRAAARPWFARLPYQATPSNSWWVRWYPLVMDFDPRPLFDELELPMLWLYGTHDSQSDALASVAVVGRLAHERNRPWSVHLFPGANHGISVPFLARANGPHDHGRRLLRNPACLARARAALIRSVAPSCEGPRRGGGATPGGTRHTGFRSRSFPARGRGRSLLAVPLRDATRSKLPP